MKIMSKLAAIVLLFLMIFITACNDKSEVNPYENSKITIELLQNDATVSFDKSVVIYEDEKYLVKSPLSDFITHLGDFFTANYELYLTTVDKIVSDGENADSLNARDYFSESDMKYVLAHFLEKGDCYIKDKENNKTISSIVMERWGDASVPLGGSGGRKFYIDGELFLETTDWIS